VNAPLHAPASDTRPTIVQQETGTPSRELVAEAMIEIGFELVPTRKNRKSVDEIIRECGVEACWHGVREAKKPNVRSMAGTAYDEARAYAERNGQGRYAIGSDNCRESECGTPIAQPYEEYRDTDHWRFIAEAAKWASGYKCGLCGHETQLETHHKTYEHLGHETPDDVIVLCRDCHAKHHGKLPELPEPEAKSAGQRWRDARDG